MLTHDQIWTAIDGLAARNGLSASGLARRAGLDPTTFNKSKRLTPDGRQRWPSTESIAKILLATGASLDEFVAMVTQAGATQETRLPLLAAGTAARTTDIVADRQRRPAGWSEIALATLGEPHAVALEVEETDTGGLYRDGDLLLIVPGAQLRRGDRLVARLTNGSLVIGELKRETADTLDLVHSGGPEAVRVLNRGEIGWTARIHWASQ